MHFRIVGHHEHQPAAHADIGEGEQRVGGDIEAHMLHRRQRPDTAETGADGDFERHFFVRRPGGIDAFIVNEIFEDFRARRARVSGGDFDPGLESAAGNGLIAGENSFFHAFSFGGG